MRWHISNKSLSRKRKAILICYYYCMKKFLSIFVISFILNLVWEYFHSFLYAHYMGGDITFLVLFEASLIDALIITILSVLFLKQSFFQKHSWIIIFVGILISIFIEWFALATGMWVYNSYMPILPFLGTGLTPTIQLGLLGYLSLKLEKIVDKLF